jgi:hypothetical protein
MDVESLIPAKTLPAQPAAVEPIAAVPEAQGDSGIADQSSTPESRELELWLKSSDVGLSPDEQAELSALQNTVPQEQTQNGIEQWPAASPDVATQANDVQGADVQRSDGDQRRDMGEGQRPDTNAKASLPSVGEDLALRDEGPSVQALNPSINPQQEILSEPTPVEAQQAAPQGFEPQQVQADAAPGIAPWPDPSQPVTQAQTRAPSRWQSCISFAAYTTTMFKRNWRDHSQIALNCIMQVVGGLFCFLLVPITLVTAAISTCRDGSRYVKNKASAGLAAKRIDAITVSNEELTNDVISRRTAAATNSATATGGAVTVSSNQRSS